jgi:hypothetical protein
MGKKLEAVPFVTVPVGWMRCVACSDYQQRPGTMWLGYNFRTHEDDVIACPVCQGTGQVPRFKYLDARTGQELDYDRPGQRFVPADTSRRVTASDVVAPSRIIIT